MLNINRRISISRVNKNRIKTHVRLINLNKGSWHQISKKVKNEISKRLFFNQGFYCVYCERELTGLNPQIDHFANKSDFPQFTFTSTNLFYSCSYCNSSGVKGSKSTINNLHERYDLCEFSIVHPYNDNVDNEIIFQDADKLFYDIDECTIKGRETIDFFDFGGIMMTNIRTKKLLFERKFPLLTDDEKKLIRAAVAYKS